MNPAKRAEIFARLQALNPHPTTELEYRTPFELLVAVILSAQATDKSVNLATRELFRVASTPAAIAALGYDGLVPFIQRIGLYRSKAKHVIETCERLLAEHAGEVPRTRAALEQLPGVSKSLQGANSYTIIEDAAVYGRLREVTEGPDGAIYLATSNRDGRGRPNSGDDQLLRMTPR